VKLTVVGCSPAWTNAAGAHSGYLVEAGSGRILLDCGPGVLSRLRVREPWPKLDAIVISHLHLDHCGDLVPWLWGHLLGPAKGTPAPDLWLPPGGLGRLTAFASAERFAEAFTLREYEDATTFDAAGLAVTPRRVVHYSEPTWGLRVEHGGTALAYSADSAPTPALVELARDADAFLCEASLTGPDLEPRGHMNADEARELAAAAGARRLLITHRDAEDAVDELVYEGFELEP
jgi:ribonuclease BN (tRNA processing enzyme)